MAEALDVITIGEAMAMFVAAETGDLAAVEHFSKRVAGAELNVATGLARLGFQVAWISRVGDDVLSQFVRNCVKQERVHDGGVTVDARYPTGFQLKSRVDNGTDPTVAYFRKGSAASHLSVDDFTSGWCHRTWHLHLSGVAAALSDSSRALLHHAAGAMKAAGKTLSFDPNLRPSLWQSEAQMVREINRLACQADWVLPDIAEGQLLTGENAPEGIADFYLARGVQIVVVKTGRDGAWYKNAAGDSGAVAAVPVAHVVDTVGAGDGFAVGVISALLEGKSLRAAVSRGNAIGARAIQFQGDSEGLPTRAELGDA